MADILKQIGESLYEGKHLETAELVRQALEQGLSPAKVLSGLIGGMDRVGQDFKSGVLFVPEVLLAARAMHAAMAVLRPLLAETGVPRVGTYLIGTVQGDLHDIGKNLVRMMLEGAGFEVVDLGTDVAPERFVAAIREHRPEILGMSALLTTTMPAMQKTIGALEQAGLRNQVKVMVGGAPVTQAWAEEIGADGYAPDAATAVEVARRLLGLS